MPDPRKLPDILAHLRAVIANPNIDTTLIQTQDLAVVCDAAEDAEAARVGTKQVSGYEVIDPIRDDTQDATIAASYTASGGIKIEIINDDMGPDWACFFLTADQAERIGNALIRWAAALETPKSPDGQTGD